MISFLSQPWPWYVGGTMFSLVMLLIVLAGKSFGVSSTMRTLCAIGGAGRRFSFFNYNWKDEIWNLTLVGGALIGGFIATTSLQNPDPIAISAEAAQSFQALGVSTDFGQLAPVEIFSWQGLFTLKGFLMIVVGGFLVGFGTRYANGCTSGHAITGLSTLQLPSLIAVIGFFIGGLLVTFFVLPSILAL